MHISIDDWNGFTDLEKQSIMDNETWTYIDDEEKAHRKKLYAEFTEAKDQALQQARLVQIKQDELKDLEKQKKKALKENNRILVFLKDRAEDVQNDISFFEKLAQRHFFVSEVRGACTDTVIELKEWYNAIRLIFYRYQAIAVSSKQDQGDMQMNLLVARIKQ